jgi:hypothetical protein
MKPKAVIFDLDGTLANCEHRRHHLTKSPKDWESFYAEILEDRVNQNVCGFWNSCIPTRIIVSGRPTSLYEDTTTWLHMNDIWPTAIYMRKEGDFRPDDIVKKELYHEFIEPSFDVVLVLDDRDKVVKMWRSLGLECWQVANGDF